MSPRIEPLPTGGPLFEGAVAVYAAAFREPPYSDFNRGHELRARLEGTHRRRAGFSGFVAIEGETVTGIAYGYHSTTGQWWYDHVRPAVQDQLGTGVAVYWLDDAYELVEVAVAPSSQRRGTGEALIRRLMQDRPERTSILSTRTDSRAHELYARMGYQTLVQMQFWKGDKPYYVMGAELPLAAARAARGTALGTVARR
jgi:ribosomal protein S18 acetylase RimI-like enzyme